MSTVDTIVNELDKLVKQGEKLALNHRPAKDDLTILSFEYESWYTTALAAIRQLVPERLDDFRDAYRTEKRKSITYATYTIHDYLLGLVIRYGNEPLFDPKHAYTAKLLKQLSILGAARDVAPLILRDIRTALHSELLDSDIENAKELLKANHLRSAGVVCGVALEGHLKSVIKRHGINITKKKLVLNDLNDTLKNANVYDTPRWRSIQQLADIRNLCAHSGDREPKKSEVEDLIEGTEKVIKQVF